MSCGAAGLLAVVLLTACTSPSDDFDASKMTPPASSSGTAAPTPQMPGDATAEPSPGEGTEACDAHGRFVFGTSEDSSAVTMEGLPVDGGPTEHASGVVETDSDGIPIVYVVANGDNEWRISNRLCYDGILRNNGIASGSIREGDRLSLTPRLRLGGAPPATNDPGEG